MQTRKVYTVMRSTIIAAAFIALPALASAQALNTQSSFDRAQLRDGRTYDSKNSSLEKQGTQYQYGTWTYTPTASTRNGTQVSQPYSYYRYGNDTILGGNGSYARAIPGGTTSMAGNYSFGTRASMGRTN